MFCKKITSNDLKGTIEVEHENFKSQVRVDCETISSSSSLVLITNDVSQSKANPMSIDYEWTTNAENVNL